MATAEYMPGIDTNNALLNLKVTLQNVESPGQSPQAVQQDTQIDNFSSTAPGATLEIEKQGTLTLSR